jgi:hypothetical protein
MPDTIGPEAIIGDFTIGEGNVTPPLITTQTRDVSIRAEVLNGFWETYGVERDVSVDPESLQASANEWGPDKASFTLRRSPWAAWPDLSPFTPIEIEVGGVLIWEGFTSGTPLKAGVEEQINVQAEGWQYQLDDDLYRRVYVHATLTDWKDARSYPEMPLGTFLAAPQVQVEAGQIVLSLPKGMLVSPNTAAGIILDLGEPALRTLTVQFGETTGFPAEAGKYELYMRAGATPLGAFGGEEIGAPINPATPSTLTYTAVTAERYVCIFLWTASTTETLAVDHSLRVTGLSVFSESAYESGGSSVLKASAAVEDALTHAPLISTDLSQIAVAEDLYDIPALTMTSAKTPREMIEAVNAFHNWLTKIDLSRRMVFAPRPSEPQYEYGSWSGEEVSDVSANEGAEIYDKVLVEGTEADGTALTVTVTATGNIVAERDFNRAQAIQISNVLTQAMGEKLGEVFLDEHQTIPFSGSVTANVGSIRNVQNGQPCHPSLLLRHAQELLRISHMIDPSSGGVGRDGAIAAVSYAHATQSAEVTLGVRTDNLSILLDRLAAAEEIGS